MTYSSKLRAAGFAIAFLATIIGANYALDRWGIVGVGFGLTAGAGVYFAGLSFGLRDALHEATGPWVVIAAVIAGAALSWLIEDDVAIPGGHAPIAVASGAAFLLSEFCDLAVYQPLRERQWSIAVIASNLVGAVVDTALFLWLAFGSLDLMAGQILGKAYMIAPALVIVGWLRSRQDGHAEQPAVAVAT